MNGPVDRGVVQRIFLDAVQSWLRTVQRVSDGYFNRNHAGDVALAPMLQPGANLNFVRDLLVHLVDQQVLKSMGNCREVRVSSATFHLNRIQSSNPDSHEKLPTHRSWLFASELGRMAGIRVLAPLHKVFLRFLQVFRIRSEHEFGSIRLRSGGVQ